MNPPMDFLLRIIPFRIEMYQRNILLEITVAVHNTNEIISELYNESFIRTVNTMFRVVRSWYDLSEVNEKQIL